MCRWDSQAPSYPLGETPRSRGLAGWPFPAQESGGSRRGLRQSHDQSDQPPPLPAGQTVCLITASNKDLREAVADGTFRADLYGRWPAAALSSAVRRASSSASDMSVPENRSGPTTQEVVGPPCQVLRAYRSWASRLISRRRGSHWSRSARTTSGALPERRRLISWPRMFR